MANSKTIKDIEFPIRKENKNEELKPSKLKFKIKTDSNNKSNELHDKQNTKVTESTLNLKTLILV
ncbi:MAG: hypothetical protein K2L64_02910 [Ureaplasma sp.]|nr:hypothetical protein [Ureaplasma sp.]